IKTWLKDCCDEGPEHRGSPDTLYQSWCDWCESKKEDAGSFSVFSRKQHGKDDPLSIRDGFRQLTAEQIVTLALAYDTARQLGIDLYALGGYCADIVSWVVRKDPDRIQRLLSDRLHLQECRDPDCEARWCRIARGKAPLTDADIE